MANFDYSIHPQWSVSVALPFVNRTHSHVADPLDTPTPERALQPGTGTTDVIVGGYFSIPPEHEGPSYFAQANCQAASAEADHFKPGNQLSITAGMRYPFAASVAGLFQINSIRKQRDSGSEGEPDLSGGTFVFASPGIGFAVTRDTQIHVFAQLPLVQDVNGIQQTAKQTYIAGLRARF